MDTVKSFKGYGKVDEAEDREFKRRTRRRLILIAVSTALLIAIVTGISIAVVRNNRNNHDNNPNYDNSPSSISNSIKAMCTVTQYPDSCFTSISSMKGANASSDPEALFKLSLVAASDALANLAKLPDSVSIPSNDKRLQEAVRNCKELFRDAVDRLQDSIASMSPTDPNEKLLSSSKISDLRTWLSAALTNQDTCLDGFEGTTGNFQEKFEQMMTNSTQFTSNSLAIATGISGILKNLDFPLHRKLLSTSVRQNNGQFPGWISSAQRRVLLQSGDGVSPNVTVAQDGSGQVSTITEAVAMVPKKSLYPFVIYVKKGVYEENVVLDKSKWNVHVYGDGMYETVVTGSLNFVDGTPTFSTATFGELLFFIYL